MIEKVLIVSDDAGIPDAMTRFLQRFFFVDQVGLWPDDGRSLSQYAAIIARFDLADRDKVGAFRDRYAAGAASSVPKIFVVSGRQRVIQAESLGACKTVPPSAGADALRMALASANMRLARTIGGKPSDTLELTQRTFSVLQTIAGEARSGGGVRREDVSAGARDLWSAFSVAGIMGLLNTVNLHHSYSCRHSLRVASLTLAFTDHLRFGRDDRMRMAIGALVHDVGKARIPLRILDKEGPLSEAETGLVRTHPRSGRAILERSGEWDPLTLKLVHEHHELLDGTGYPNGLPAGDIIDPVRLLTIIDFFSTLIDNRASTSPMPLNRALKVMHAMRSKLDIHLLKAFEPVGQQVILGLSELAPAA